MEGVVTQYRQYCVHLASHQENLLERICILENLASMKSFEASAVTSKYVIAEGRVDLLRKKNLSDREGLEGLVKMRVNAFTELEKEYYRLQSDYAELNKKYSDAQFKIAEAENQGALFRGEKNRTIERTLVQLRDYKNENAVINEENEQL